MRENKKIMCGIIALLLTASSILSGCGSTIDPASPSATGSSNEKTQEITYSFAAKEEGIKLLMSNKDYYDGFSQNDLDYKLQKKDADMKEYLEFAGAQVRDFSDEDKKVIDDAVEFIENQIKEKGYSLPELNPIVFIKTTQKEEYGAGAYTHGTQIYLGDDILASEDRNYINEIMAHELFHCLTRSAPEFRKDMYKLIHFTVNDKDYDMPSCVKENFISNPDVEQHDSYSTFTIDGEKVECFTASVTIKPFEREGDSFFFYLTTALVPIDGRDIYYTPEEASDFYDVFGNNTDYVIDPEECMADNFAYAIVYGNDGPEGKGYPTPEIIEGIIEYLSK